jgi:hypothetical protein
MCAAVATLVATLMLSCAAVHAAAAGPRRCATSGVRELAADARGRMYQDRRGTQDVYVCLRSRNRPVLFADERPELSNERVTSPYAAGVIFSLSGAPSFYLTIADMRSRKQASKAFGSNPYDLVLTKHGVAWFILPPELNPDGTGPIGPGYVKRMDINGGVVDLDVGNVSQLALSGDGRRLYWLKDGVVHTQPV